MGIAERLLSFRWELVTLAIKCIEMQYQLLSNLSVKSGNPACVAVSLSQVDVKRSRMSDCAHRVD